MQPELLTSLQNPLLKRFRAAAKSRKEEASRKMEETR